MKITGIYDLGEDLNIRGWCCHTGGIYIDRIYEIGEYDDDDGYIKFKKRTDGNNGWYIGCCYGIRFRFEDNSTIDFVDLYQSGVGRNSDKINEVLEFLRNDVLGIIDEPETEMPDIFQDS